MSARVQTRLILVGALATIVAVGCGSSSGATSGVATFPMANTPDASPKTTISFRGVTPGKLTGVVVKGSKSGRHGGTLKPHPDGNGVSFIPKRGFRRGETVTVDAKQQLLGQKHGVVKFRIEQKPKIGVPSKIQGDPGGHPPGEQHFHSTTIKPPSVKILKRTSKIADGDLFLSPKAGPGEDGTLLVDSRGQLVWWKRAPTHNSTFDFRTQTYEGKPALTWWQGEVHHGQGRGAGEIYSTSYHKLAEVPPGNGYQADFHEFQLSRDGKTAFLLIYEPVKVDLRAMGGPKNGSALDGIVQEVDIKTGLVLFEWHTLGSVSLRESYASVPKSSPADISHVNSVYEEKDGNLLVSARDMHTALELDRSTGKILWRLGGKRSDYKMGGGAQFVGQHDIRRAPNGRMTIFDNGSPPTTSRKARALVLNVNDDKKKATVWRSFRRGSSFVSPSQGNVQALSNGNFMVGWGGDEPFFTEYTSSGSVALDGEIVPTQDDTYRVWHLPWTAQPSRPPDVAAQAASGQTEVWVSWNGATEVAKWQILSGPTAATLVPGKTFRKKGFETHTTFSGNPSFVAVRALDKDGKTLATSKPVQPK